jgi:hypothetical protein
MGSSCYDIGLPMDLQEPVSRLAEVLGAKVPEVAHALIRDGLAGIALVQASSGRDHTAEANDWWKRVGSKDVRGSK